MRPMINKMAFGGSWLDSAKEMADKVGDYAEGIASDAGAAAAGGATSALTDSLDTIASNAAAAHGAALGESASGTLAQTEKTMKYIGYAALAVGAGALLFFVSRRKG